MPQQEKQIKFYFDKKLMNDPIQKTNMLRSIQVKGLKGKVLNEEKQKWESIISASVLHNIHLFLHEDLLMENSIVLTRYASRTLSVA